MAFNKDQNEPKVPLSNVEQRETSNLLPRFYRTKDNKKFLQGTLDQLVQPGTVKKISGYIGRESAKATNSTDIFLAAADKSRQDYQLEPAAVVKDYLGNTTFFKDYIDHINTISVFDGNVDNHTRINRQEFYSWNPHIDWDKFVNFQQYYWLPFGPDAIPVAGQQKAIISEYTVELSDEGDNFAFLFTPNGLTRNPTLTLFRGQTYVFDIKSPNHPFSIKTTRTSGTLDRYFTGVNGVAIEDGKITFTVPFNCPDVLFYVSENEVDTGGVFHVLDITENTFLDVNADLLGKKNYTIPTGTDAGVSLSNGMKLYFTGNVSPAEYETGYWYVEGVGTAIKLISERELEVRASYTIEQSVLFDDLPFDQLPYSEVGTFPSRPDYITINRSSLDNNPWSRYNRWFHKDVIDASAKINGKFAEFDQLARATRPIIEFNPNIKLYNYGISTKAGVDVIDNYTKDVFSTVEGSLGYNVDGIDLADGMRVLFNADTDVLVKNKIYKVNFIEVQIPGRQVSFNAETGINLDNSFIVFTYPHGLIEGSQVTYLENGNAVIPGLTNRAIYYVKIINDITVALYKDSALTKQAEIFNISTGTQKLEVFSGLRRQINLVEEPDSVPVAYESVAVRFGINEKLSNGVKGNQGQNYWFDGTNWVLCQSKLSINQPPMFDVFDAKGNSYSDLSVYEGSSFKGTKLFSYKKGSGTNDTVLGFPLSYKNINNVGDIVFNFDLLTDSFSYKVGLTVETKNTDIGYLKKSKTLDLFSFENGWKTSQVTKVQPIVRVYKDSGLVNVFPIDVFDDKNDLVDLEVRVYVNGHRLNKDQYFIADDNKYKLLGLVNNVSLTDIVTLKCYAKQKKNSNGYYEIPLNLQNNPLNESITEFTLGQVVDHVGSIIDNIYDFAGTYPGGTNLRDLGDITSYGTRFVQHSGPLNLALYHFGDKSANLIKALDKARNEYGQFKRSFLITATNSGVDLDPKRHVDLILQEMTKDKPKTLSYYLSDMFAYTASNKIEIEVLDGRIKSYPLTSAFNLDTCSNRAVNVYVNEEQLVFGRDYVFGTEAFIEISSTLKEGDLIEIYEYESTDGCFCPPTPSKLGIYPKFEPRKFVDTSYVEPTEVIQGHDGSITVAFGDFRDDLILELEKRIYNNIKTSYDPEMFDIYDYIPGYSRETDYSVEEFNKILSTYFFQWTQNVPQDFTKHDDYDRFNSFTFNYADNYTPDGQSTPAGWRGIYRWMFDTTTPHLTPWEMLGYSIKPTWWESVYGPAPYTKDNVILWNDLKEGRIREPNRPTIFNTKFARPILELHQPVDESGNLLSPIDSGIAQGYVRPGADGSFVFGDEAKVEAAWRRSSYYSFAVLQTLLLMHPSEVLGRCFDRSRIVKNLAGQLVYSETGLRLRLQDLVIPSTANSSKLTRNYACGLINYITDYLTSETTSRLDQYSSDMTRLTNSISTRLGGFTSKDKYRLILDSKSPKSSGGVFVPAENYFVDLNIGSAVKKVIYSGVIVTKFADGFELRGYHFDSPYFNYYDYLSNDHVIRVGGISESYTNWAANKTYVAGKIVFSGSSYYRVLVNHTSGDSFDETLYVKIPELPLTGGTEAMLRKNWIKDKVKKLAYGTRLQTIQEVVDVIQGYGVYLQDQGFVFEDFNSNIASITNWETSIKEFLFWTTQGWEEGSVLSLSPAADRLVFKSSTSVVDSLIDPFYGYNIYKVDGNKLDVDFINVYRGGNDFILEPYNTSFGIYAATLHLVQKEHVVILDDTTLFNDTIYDKPAGYRQEKIKVLGYITTNWNGGFEIPGFIYDRAIINEWTPWTDFNLGDIVKYKEFYYSATKFLAGTESFNDEDWVLLEKKPKAEMLPNLDYRAEQFTDFYDLESDNFDAEQQKVAQHLTGYQKRQYLENIINNDVSQYKFYQGMISEKGTENALNKLFDVLSSADQESLTFDEEWAFRVGEYGALDTFEEVEFILDEGQFKINPQPIEIVDQIDPTQVDFVYRQTTGDVYIKPTNFVKDIWSKKKIQNFVRTPGYVRREDVKVSVDRVEDLVNVDITDFIEGDYVWAAFEGIDWNVYRFTKSDFTIVNAVYEKGVLILECDKAVNYAIGTVVGIKNSNDLKGFYVINNVILNKIYINIADFTLKEFIDKDKLVFYVMTSNRVKSSGNKTIDDLNDYIQRYIKEGETFWVDDNGEGKWSVYKNDSTTGFNKALISNINPSQNLNFGLGLAIDNSGTLSAVATATGVFIYEKSPTGNDWQTMQFIPTYSMENSVFTAFGSVMKFSKDGKFLIIADPDARLNYYQEGYVGIYIRTPNRNYVLVQEFVGGSSQKFLGSNVAITNISDEYRLAVSSNGEVRTYKYSPNTADWQYSQTISTGEADFGTDISLGSTTFKLVISSPVENKVYVYNYDSVAGYYNTAPEEITPGTLVALTDNVSFGSCVSISANETHIAIGAPKADFGSEVDAGKLFVYKFNGSTYTNTQVIESRFNKINEQFATELEFMNDNQTLVVYSLNSDAVSYYDFTDQAIFDNNSTRFVDVRLNVGRVDVYDKYNNNYIYGKSLESNYQVNTNYGRRIAVANNVILASANTADDVVATVKVTNVIVGKTYRIKTVGTTSKAAWNLLAGTVNKKYSVGDKFVAAALPQWMPSTSYSKSDVVIFNNEYYSANYDLAGSTEFLIDNWTNVGGGVVEQVINKSGQVYSYVKSSQKVSWQPVQVQSYKVDISTIKKAFLYNKVSNEIVKYLDVVDPTQGKIPGIADQEVKFKTYYDPATYSVGQEGVNIDLGQAWTDKQVGMIWWDLSKARFLDSESGDVVYKTSAWNKLYDTASIDIYEWVKSSVTPTRWDELVGTEQGNALGISGTTKYGPKVYSVSKIYDNVSQTFVNTYYFWVKNKVTVPNVEGRTLPAIDIAKLISDPLGYGYTCLAITDSNSLAVVNGKKYLSDTNVVLLVQYWTSDVRTSNYHSQWKLLSTNRNTVIPSIIEDKWLQSLVGKDYVDRVVPDITLPAKQRYGIEYRPRQGMFVNRVEALKQYVERVNTVLKDVLIADIYDISKLSSFEPAPLDISGEWDVRIDSNLELRFVVTTQKRQAQLTPIIENGAIIGATIIDSGKGYGTYRVYETNSLGDAISWYGPVVNVTGQGQGASVRTIINLLGEVIGVDVLEAGEGYLDDTLLLVRDFTVLVNSDSETNNWAMYTYDRSRDTWYRTTVQSYNVNTYWTYIDWYASGYNQYVKVDHLLNNTYELVTNAIDLGEVVKIRNIGSGGWVLLEKYNNLNTIDYTLNFKVVGRENGTIQFLDSIYSPIKGFDKFLLDSVGYDIYPVEELRIIFDVVKNNLLVDDLKVEYLKLFFASVRYAMYEQTYLDWAFKTSFVKSQHNLGELKQKVTYNSDNLESFEQYINEVKPYHTKIREYVSNYNAVDPSRSAVTDFDLLPVIDELYNVSPLTVSVNEQGEIVSDFNQIYTYPWAFWADNLGFEITSIELADQGEGYADRPIVEITGTQFPGGTPAVAKAYITRGKINRIELISAGSKWVKAPTVTISGVLLEGGRPAKAVAIIGGSPIRTNYIKMKFDRLSKTYQVTNLAEIETFTGSTTISVSGSRTQFPLKWSPNIEFGKFKVFVNGAEVLKSDYSLTSVTKIVDGETRYSGLLTFAEPPVQNAEVVVEYLKNYDHLAAVDRINFFYNPQTGQLGKDLSQLMTGVDYGGVTVTGLGFENSYGWDSQPWQSDVWDAGLENFEDYSVTVTNTNNLEFRLPYVPAKEEVITVYVSKFDFDPVSPTYKTYLPAIRIDDINYLTVNQTNRNAVMTSFVGDGETDIIIVPITANLEVYTEGPGLTYGDRVIFRKITSDGSLKPREDDYDTELRGGDLAYSSATGFAPDDVILDGDGLITPMTSHAPEEVVPGHIMDTLAIKVFTRPAGGAPNIMFKTYVADGTSTEFTIGQYFLDNNSVIVKLNDVILSKDEYTIDYKNNLVVFNSVPAASSVVSIISISFNSSTVLDLDYFVADGVTTEYITKAPWLSNVNVTVLVNGVQVPYTTFTTDGNYATSGNESWKSRVGIRFATAPAAGDLINYIVDQLDVEQTASIVKSETITYVTGQSNYTLTYPVGVDVPYDPNVLVKFGNSILRGASYSYFTLANNQLVYELNDTKYQNLTLDQSKINVYLNGKKLVINKEYFILINDSIPYYTIDANNTALEYAGVNYQVGDILSLPSANVGDNTANFTVNSVGPNGEILTLSVTDIGSYTDIPELLNLTGGTGVGARITTNFITIQDLSKFSVSLKKKKYVAGGKLVVGISSNSDYEFVSGTEIKFNKIFANGDLVEILSFYNHNVLGIERTVDTFNQVTTVDKSSLEYNEYLGKLGGSFRLRSTVPSGDFVWVIKNGTLLSFNTDYYLENDMQTVKLFVYPAPTDVIEIIAFTNTVVTDSFGYMQFKDALNRTHFKRLNNEKTTKLTQPLGQFDRSIFVEDPFVLDTPNPVDNRPGIIEINGERIEYFAIDGQELTQLRRGTLGTGIPNEHPVGEAVQCLGSSETIPYKDNFTTIVGSADQNPDLYTTGTMQLIDVTSKDEIEVFVGGYRLKKNPYVLFNQANGYPYSPVTPISETDPVGFVKEGDTKLPPEFTVSSTGVLQLATVPVKLGVKLQVVVVKKQGRLWNDQGKRLGNSNNTISNFLTAVSAPWPN